MKTITKVEDHMKSLGLSYDKKMDRYLYATLLDSGAVSAPRSLRGTKCDPVSGYLWKRKLEFIIKQRYDVELKDVVALLGRLNCVYSCSSTGLNFYVYRLASSSEGALIVSFLLDSRGRSHLIGCSIGRFHS